ncbi:Myb domain plants domain-containing protein [Dioscorea alata]|uniref:Myb domain plants domain-containing protein n=1 Tax=Dioscorea alata TaxID=55571 RepID=A0ACB7WP50_DIOAL|nr:Myb domain plants domain-containing protein [Dioscorea alata]
MDVDGGGESGGTEWDWCGNKEFENALAQHFLDSSGEPEMERIAAAMPGKSVEELAEHYRLLEEDVNLIESGQVGLMEYVNEGSPEQGGGKKSGGQAQERRKGVPWSEEEHKQFLCGLKKFGKGDWRSIARHFVLTRTPTQVASHAQKYFNRLKASNKDRRRSSIHDITIVDSADASDSQRTITSPRVGAMLPPVITAPTVGPMLPHGMPGIQTPQMPVLPSGVSPYGAAPHANFPVGRIPNMAYGPYPMQAPVTGAPMKFLPKSDQMLHHPSSNR